ncbi:MAG: PAS domain S-box protein [Polyangiaceae bacterium]
MGVPVATIQARLENARRRVAKQARGALDLPGLLRATTEELLSAGLGRVAIWWPDTGVLVDGRAGGDLAFSKPEQPSEVPEALRLAVAERAARVEGDRVTVFISGERGGALLVEHPEVAGVLETLDEVADVLSLALERRSVVADQGAEHTVYSTLVKHLKSGFARVRVISVDGRVVDVEYLEHNDAFRNISGLPTTIEGRRLTSLSGDAHAYRADVLERCERVIKTGHAERYERQWLGTDRWLSVALLKVAADQIVTIVDDVSARKHAELGLAASELRFRSMFERAHTGIAFLGSRGEILQVNQRLCAMLSCCEQDVRGARLESLLVDDGPANAQLAALLAGRLDDAATLERLARRKDSEPLWLRLTFSKSESASGEAVVVFAEDITSQREAEERLRESETRLALFVEYAPAAIALLDHDMRYMAVSNRFVTDYGLPTKHLVGVSHYDCFPEIPEQWRQVHLRCLAGATERSDCEPFARQDGNVDWVRWEIQPWHLADGSVGGIVLFSEILNEKVTAERALAASNARFQAIVEQAGIGIAHVDAETRRYSMVNDQACAIWRRSREELLSLTWLDITFPEDIPGDLEAVRRLADGAPSFTREKRFVDKSGAVIWCRVTVTKLSVPGEAPSVVVMVEDIGPWKRAQETLRERESHLATLFERSIAGLVVTRLSDRRFVEVSDSFVRMFGWSREELIGKTTEELGLHSDGAVRTAVYEHHRASEPFEVRARRKSGEEGDFLLASGQIELHGEPCLVSVIHDITPLRRAHTALRESERQLRTVFEFLPIGIAEVDSANGTIIRANPRLATITGYATDELVGMSIATVLAHPDDRERTRGELAALASGETEELHVERRTVCKDGSISWIAVSANRLTSAAGGQVLAAIEDIQQRRLDEAALHLRQSALDAAANAIAITDTEGIVRFVNPAFCTLTGYSKEEVVGSHTRILRSGFQSADFYRSLWRTIKSGRVWRGELVNRKKDGAHYFEDMTITPVSDDTGRLSQFISIKQDISARKQAEASLRESEERFRVLVDNLEDLVCVADSRGLISFVNRAASAFGFDANELMGRALASLFHEEDRPAVQESLASGDDNAPREVRLVDAIGALRPTRIRVRPLRIGAFVAGATCVVIDLTARRETEEQLRAAQKMEAVGRLAGGVAHDFNNLLSVILSYSELLSEELDGTESAHADLEQIIEAAHRAERLTRQLLAFSRKQLLTPELLDLQALIAGLGKMLGRLIGEDIELNIQDSAGLPTVEVDRGAMEQVLMNLVVNARDAMPNGGRITIATHLVSLDESSRPALSLKSGQYIELEVRDTGSGMSEETRRRAFEPFFTTKGVGKGTGLGLSMVFGIVRQSRGAIEIDSQLGSGTTFRIYLPCADESTRPPEVSLIESQPTRGHECVLVIEDEAPLRAVIGRVLTRAGYEVLLCSGAPEALASAYKDGSRVRLILSDLVMPIMSGRELAEHLLPLCPGARVLFMSGYTDETIERLGVLEASFLRKPFDMHVLADRVRQMLDSDESPPPPSAS